MKTLQPFGFASFNPLRPCVSLCVRKIATREHRGVVNQLLMVAILVISTLPLHVHAQQAGPAKLKADAQKIVRVIRGDRAKTLAYCQINSLGGDINQAVREKDEQKADALTRKINDLEKHWGPNNLLFSMPSTISTKIRKNFGMFCRCSIRSTSPVHSAPTRWTVLYRAPRYVPRRLANPSLWFQRNLCG
jgi:hypothetical protein